RLEGGRALVGQAVARVAGGEEDQRRARRGGGGGEGEQQGRGQGGQEAVQGGHGGAGVRGVLSGASKGLRISTCPTIATWRRTGRARSTRASTRQRRSTTCTPSWTPGTCAPRGWWTSPAWWRTIPRRRSPRSGPGGPFRRSSGCWRRWT